MKRLIGLAGFGMLIALLVVWASNQGSKLTEQITVHNTIPYDPVEITTFDSEGNPAQMLFTHVPQRVVADWSTAEILLALGKGDQVVGAVIPRNSENYTELMKEYPEELKKTEIYNGYDLDLETVLALQPDFIMGWKSTFSPQRFRSTAWWNKRGVNTYIVGTSNHLLPTGTIADECKYISDMGKIFNVKDRSNRYIDEIQEIIDQVKQQNIAGPPQVVMVIEIGGRELFNYDEGWIVGDMVRQMGGTMPMKGRKISIEELIYCDPDVIFAVYAAASEKKYIDQFFKEVRFNSLKAVHNRRIYPISFRYMYTPGVKIIDGLHIIRDGLYPGKFQYKTNKFDKR